MWRRHFLMASLLALGATRWTLADEAPAPGKQVAAKFASQADPASSLGYWIALPKEHGAANKHWPVMLFLHGAGERGADLKVVKVHGPPKLIEQGREFPFIVVSPQCPKDHWWPGDIQQHLLAELLDDVIRRHHGDPTRVYVTGLSMGGFGTWELTARHPDRVAAAVPICGRGDPQLGERLKPVPFWVFHGAKDFGVPLRYSESMVDAVTKAGGQAKLTVYPEAGHDSWTETYNNSEVYDWLLKHQLQVAPSGPIAKANVAFTEIGFIKTAIGEAAQKSEIEVSLYASSAAADAAKLKSAVEKHRHALTTRVKSYLAAKSIDELKGLAGLKKTRTALSQEVQAVLGTDAPSGVEALLDIYFVKKDGRLQLDP